MWRNLKRTWAYSLSPSKYRTNQKKRLRPPHQKKQPSASSDEHTKMTRFEEDQ